MSINTGKRLIPVNKRPEIIVVSSIDKYRKLAVTVPREDEVVLEIGCSTGKTTEKLMLSGAYVYAVDISKELTAKLKQDLCAAEKVTVAQVDARDVEALTQLVENPNVVFIDIGGDSRLNQISLQLQLCLLSYNPRIIVIRNFELAWISAAIVEVEHPDDNPRRLRSFDDTIGKALAGLLELSHSPNVNNRSFAARKLRKFRCDEARERLRELCHDPNKQVRKIAAYKFQKPDDLVTC